jgi:wyosine [tRNA(Phe)-imidazoG37] synthetase (radical SAM superfamily)
MVLPLKVDILYGPVNSRRLGRSLGINLMPRSYKLCSFNCVYCHYGWTKVHTLDVQDCVQDLPPLDQVVEKVRIAARSGLDFEYLTFSGNGEPTLHPQFPQLVEEIVQIRNQYRPEARIALLSNSTGVVRADVRESISRIDLPVFKLDAGSEETLRKVNRPVQKVDLEQIVELLCSLDDIYLQTLLIDGRPSNVSVPDLEAYFQHVARIQPREVHIYSIDRPVPDPHLVRVAPQKLQEIARTGEQKTGVKFRAFWMDR